LAKWRLALENLSLKSKDLDFSGKDEKALLQIQVKLVHHNIKIKK
jgi:hypothetical protein